jgi:hypothetical protein
VASKTAKRASSKARCPICRGTHSCSVTEDGLHFCWRTHDSNAFGWVYLEDTRNGFGMFRSAEDPQCWLAALTEKEGRAARNGHAPTGQQAPAKFAPEPDLEAVLAAAVDGELGTLAADVLGVDEGALRALGVCYVPEAAEEPAHWLMPERDAGGKLIGLARRYLTGAKKQYPGSRRGLAYPPGWAEMIAGAVLLPEGHSDTAALMTMGLTAVGRPLNLGGVELLIPMLRDVAKAEVPVVVIGENDKKANGQWPGLEGARRTAQDLADYWRVPVWCALPPEGAKDARRWLNDRRIDLRDRAALDRAGQEVLGALARSATLLRPAGQGFLGKGIAAADRRFDPPRGGDCEGTVKGVNELVLRNAPLYLSKTNSFTPFLKTNSFTPTHLHISQEGTLEAPLPEPPGPGPSFRHVVKAGQNPRCCPKHCVPLLSRREDVRKGAALRVDCDCYSCPACGPRRRCRWLLHLANCFHDHQGPLYRAELKDRGLTAKLQAVRRRDGEYAAIRRDGGRASLITTVPVDGCEDTTPDEAAERVAAGLLELARVRRPVLTSRPWQPPTDRKQTGQYTRQGQAPRGSFPRVVGDVERVAEGVRHVQLGDKLGTFFELPADWPDERAAMQYLAFGWGMGADLGDPVGDSTGGDADA